MSEEIKPPSDTREKEISDFIDKQCANYDYVAAQERLWKQLTEREAWSK